MVDGAADDRFEVTDDGHLKLKDDASLNHEAGSEIELTVTATDMHVHEPEEGEDGATESISLEITITVGDVDTGDTEGPAVVADAEVEDVTVTVNEDLDEDDVDEGDWLDETPGGLADAFEDEDGNSAEVSIVIAVAISDSGDEDNDEPDIRNVDEYDYEEGSGGGRVASFEVRDEDIEIAPHPYGVLEVEFTATQEGDGPDMDVTDRFKIVRVGDDGAEDDRGISVDIDDAPDESPKFQVSGVTGGTRDAEETMTTIMVSASAQPLMLGVRQAEGTMTRNADYVDQTITAMVEVFEVDPATAKITMAQSYTATVDTADDVEEAGYAVQLGDLDDPITGATTPLVGTPTDAASGESIRVDTGTNTVEIQWQMQNAQGAWMDLAGETGLALSLTDAQAGRMVRAKVTYMGNEDNTDHVTWVEYSAEIDVEDLPTAGNNAPERTQAMDWIRVNLNSDDDEGRDTGSVAGLFFDPDGDDTDTDGDGGGNWFSVMVQATDDGTPMMSNDDAGNVTINVRVNVVPTAINLQGTALQSDGEMDATDSGISFDETDDLLGSFVLAIDDIDIA